MQIDYDVGDVVVCISTPTCHSAYDIGKVKKGAMYRVDRFVFGGQAVHLCGIDWTNPNGMWAHRFRKLPKASDEFTEQMRKLKPNKQKVEA